MEKIVCDGWKTTVARAKDYTVNDEGVGKDSDSKVVDWSNETGFESSNCDSAMNVTYGAAVLATIAALAF